MNSNDKKKGKSAKSVNSSLRLEKVADSDPLGVHERLYGIQMVSRRRHAHQKDRDLPVSVTRKRNALR